MLTLKTERLILREYQPADWEAVHEYAKNPEILVYEPWGPNSEEETKAYVQNAINEQKKKPRKIFELCITLKNSQQLIGGVGFKIEEERPNKGYLGYIVHPDYWNRGFATEASLSLLSFVVQHCGILTIEAQCDALNLPSRSVLEKCGFQTIEEVQNIHKIKDRIGSVAIYKKTITPSISTPKPETLNQEARAKKQDI